MARKAGKFCLVKSEYNGQLGLSNRMIYEAVNDTYKTLDIIDSNLIESGSPRLSRLVELANLSAIVGNLLRGGISKSSENLFQANKPHTYPDLISNDDKYEGIEIKVALETNKPKGHLIKPGPHLTIRYVLANEEGEYILGKKNRGEIVWIWEVRLGVLEEKHFNFSNTEGDSGKTAVINAEGMNQLGIVFCDLSKCPHSKNGKIYENLAKLF